MLFKNILHNLLMQYVDKNIFLYILLVFYFKYTIIKGIFKIKK